MKRYIFFILFSIAALTSFGQSGVKLYGYVREVSPGIVPKAEGEEGEPVNSVKSRQAYLVYLSSSSKTPITPVEMWIHGERFNVRIEPVTKTPITIPNNTGKTTTLVAKTSNKVQQIVAIPFTKGKEFSLARKKAAANQLVVVYKQNGKYYSALLKKITVLDPQFSE